MDIAIKDGKIVEKVDEKKAEVVDASGMIVMPGGVDIHCHIAGAEVNSGRLLRPEDHVKDVEAKTALTRSGVGYSIPVNFHNGLPLLQNGLHNSYEPLHASPRSPPHP